MIFSTRKRFGCALLSGTCAALMVLAGCSAQTKEKEPIVSVQTTPAEKGTIVQQVTAEAVVFPLEQALIAPKITSPVKRFHVQRGSHVKKDQLLAELENADLKASAQGSQGDFQTADAGYVTTVSSGLPQQIQKAELDASSSKTAYEAQQKIYDSRKDLFQQGAIPRRDLDAAEVAVAQARSQYEQSQRQLADLKRVGTEQTLKSAQGSRLSSEGKLRAAEAQLSYSLIRSPIDGVVTDRPLYEGETATANQPMMTIMNTSRLIGKSHIPQGEATTLKVGNPAEVQVPGLDEPVKARVSLVSPALDPGSTTVEVWVEVQKPDPALKPGMSVQVSMTAKTAKDAVVVPTDAIYKNPEGAYYVLLAGPDDKAHQKLVQVGIRNRDRAQIVSGINSGDPVITAGGYAVPDGTKIKIEQPGAEGKEAATADAKPDEKAKGDPAAKKDEKKETKASGSAKPAGKEKD